MKTRCLLIMSLIIICCLSWSMISIAAKYDPFVRQAQKRLREFGYDPGPVDGIMGKKTVSAIESFQQDNGLPVTGKLNRATRQKLGIRSKGPLVFVGGKLWYADIKVPKFAGEEVDIDPGFTWGPIVSLRFANNWWVSGMFLTGTYDYGPVRDYYQDWYERGGEFSSQDAEIVVGHSFNFYDLGFDLGGGLRYTVWEWEPDARREGEEPDITTYGPMISVETSRNFGRTPVGVYLGASWVFAELGDEEDTEHVNFEGGIFFIMNKLKGTLGYRYKNYYKLYENIVGFDSDALTFKGIVGSLSYLF